MIGKRILRRIIIRSITPHVLKYVPDQETQTQCIDGIADTVLYYVDLVGIKEAIKHFRIISHLINAGRIDDDEL